MGVFMLDMLVELGEKGLSKGGVDARTFRAKLLGLIYEELLCVWFSRYAGYRVVGIDVKSGSYGEEKRAAVDCMLLRLNVGQRMMVVDLRSSL